MYLDNRESLMDNYIKGFAYMHSCSSALTCLLAPSSTNSAN